MNRRYMIFATLAAVALAAFGWAAFSAAATRSITVAAGSHLLAHCSTNWENVTVTTHDVNADCHVAPTATNTSVPPTATMAMPTATGTVTLGWHAPGAHDGLNVHEHGDAPPAWVVNSGHAPFTQTRETHTGYKGVYDTSPGGVESYLITHILSTVKARSHGDHDYQLWLRDPETGAVAYYDGVLDIGNPPPLRTSDTGERPIILSVGDGGCETWYSRPGSTVMDIGWTICGRYENFAAVVMGGVGTFRTMDWVIPCNRLPSGSALLDNCRVEFGVSRLSFLVNSKDYGAPGIAPIN